MQSEVSHLLTHRLRHRLFFMLAVRRARLLLLVLRHLRNASLRSLIMMFHDLSTLSYWTTLLKMRLVVIVIVHFSHRIRWDLRSARRKSHHFLSLRRIIPLLFVIMIVQLLGSRVVMLRVSSRFSRRILKSLCCRRSLRSIRITFVTHRWRLDKPIRLCRIFLKILIRLFSNCLRNIWVEIESNLSWLT